MDNNILSIVALCVAVVSSIIGIINHKRIRSSCCGRELEASINIENTTPKLNENILS